MTSLPALSPALVSHVSYIHWIIITDVFVSWQKNILTKHTKIFCLQGNNNDKHASIYCRESRKLDFCTTAICQMSLKRREWCLAQLGGNTQLSFHSSSMMMMRLYTANFSGLPQDDCHVVMCFSCFFVSVPYKTDCVTQRNERK